MKGRYGRMDDERLARLVGGGDEAAFAALYDRHHASLLAFCRHLVGSREDGEDALQQAFLRAHKALAAGRAPDRLRPWLFAIARNRCLTLMAARRDMALPSDEVEPSYDGLAADVQRRADLRELVADLRRLPEDQRGALVLAEWGDFSHHEIARVLGCPPAKVKALVFQARTTLIADRDARSTPCDQIRAQLETARGGVLRRGALRRHLRECDPCAAYRVAMERRRSRLAIVLPVAPTAGLKAAVLGGGAESAAAVVASGGGGALAGGVAAKALAAKAAVAVVVATGGGAAIQDIARDEPSRAAGAAPAAVHAEPSRNTAAAPAPPSSGPVGSPLVPERRAPAPPARARGRADATAPLMSAATAPQDDRPTRRLVVRSAPGDPAIVRRVLRRLRRSDPVTAQRVRRRLRRSDPATLERLRIRLIRARRRALPAPEETAPPDTSPAPAAVPEPVATATPEPPRRRRRPVATVTPAPTPTPPPEAATAEPSPSPTP